MFHRMNLVYLRKVKLLVLLLLFLGGLVLGTVTVRRGETALLKWLSTLFENYTFVRSERSAADNFCNTFLRQSLLLGGTYAVGLCAVGVPLLYFLPMLYGTGVGIVSAYLYLQFALKGIGYCALLLYPGIILSVCAILFGCSISIAMSGTILKNLLNTQKEEAPEFRKYNLKYLILIGISGITALVDTVLNMVFSGYFQFS